jgi:hypothetical protein
MSVSLKRAVEICCRTNSSMVTPQSIFDEHLDEYGYYLTVEAFADKNTDNSTINYIFYRDTSDDDEVVGLTIITNNESVHRIVFLPEGETY